MPSIRISIQIKVFALVAALVGALVITLVTVLPKQHMRSIEAAMRDKALSYVRLTAREVEPVVAFEDAETARESLGALMIDPDVLGGVVFDEQGNAIAAIGTLAGARPVQASPTSIHLQFSSAEVRATAPVVSKEGPRGTLVVSLSRDRVHAAEAVVRSTTALLAILTALGGTLGAWLIGHGMSRRLKRITKVADEVAQGNLAQAKLEDRSSDEVGQLARAFDIMLLGLSSLIEERRVAAAEENERLEVLVRARTEALDQRNAEMRLVFDNVPVGLFTIDSSGEMGMERSRAAEDWFGTPPERAKVWQHLAALDAGFGMALELGWDQVKDGVLPIELALDQLPSVLRAGASTYRMGYRAVEADATSSRVLVVASDITAELEHISEQTAHQELAAAVKQVRADRGAFSEFLNEAESIVGSLVSATSVDASLMRALHTLKGNCGMAGFPTLEATCHEMESFVAENTQPPPMEHRRELAHRFAELREVFTAFADGASARLEISSADHDALLRAIDRGDSRRRLLAQARALTHEPTERRLGRLAKHARALGTKLGRELNIVVESNGVRLEPERWAPFWASFIHVVRNAVAHGIEPAVARAAIKKKEAGTILLRTTERTRELVVEVIDDGQGIDWDALARTARARGLPYETQDQLVAALFVDGITTATAVDETKGRGVGLAAVQSITRDLGGEIRVHSSRGQGARFEFVFPRTVELDSVPPQSPSFGLHA